MMSTQGQQSKYDANLFVGEWEQDRPVQDLHTVFGVYTELN